VASRAADEAHEVASTAQEKGQELVALASRQAGELGSTVREQTARVSGEVAEQGRTLAEDARSQIEYHANAQSRRLADSLSRLGDEVQALADGRPDDAATVRPYVSDAADAVYDAADRLYGLAQDVDERGISGVLEDLQAFARRRPGTFLLGAAVAGFGLGRAVRASSDDGAAPAGPLSRPR
jgi:gas vesicle protein